jgi:hypothetical protein
MQDSGAATADSSKKRKQTSSAEKIAVEISKMCLSHAGYEMQRKLRVENSKVIFTDLVRASRAQKCTWRDDKMNPCYCKHADLKYEACLPDRKYLVRYSAQCSACYDNATTAVHLYCAFCDEVLTGSIAGPGGKISDHLITIRHVYQQAISFNAILENGMPRHQDIALAKMYISKLDVWSDTIRYRTRSQVKRIHFEDILEKLNVHLEQRVSPPNSVSPVSIPIALPLMR